MLWQNPVWKVAGLGKVLQPGQCFQSHPSDAMTLLLGWKCGMLEPPRSLLESRLWIRLPLPGAALNIQLFLGESFSVAAFHNKKKPLKDLCFYPCAQEELK